MARQEKPTVLKFKAYSTIVDPPSNEGDIPEYTPNPDETLQVKRARLLYQSRKRGILENDLILSTFAQKHLGSMDSSSLNAYDRLINNSGNEWNIYYWVTGAKPVPNEFNTPVMKKLMQHTRNENREQRFRQPDLQPI